MPFHHLSISLKYPNKPFFFFLSFPQECRSLTLPHCECRQGSYQVIKQEINKFLQCLIKIKYGDYEVAGVRLKDGRQRVGLDLDYFFFTNSTMYWNAFTLTLEGNLTQNMNICVSAHKSADQRLNDWFEDPLHVAFMRGGTSEGPCSAPWDTAAWKFNGFISVGKMAISSCKSWLR